jgi:hypothetical protein
MGRRHSDPCRLRRTTRAPLRHTDGRRIGPRRDPPSSAMTADTAPPRSGKALMESSKARTYFLCCSRNVARSYVASSANRRRSPPQLISSLESFTTCSTRERHMTNGCSTIAKRRRCSVPKCGSVNRFSTGISNHSNGRRLEYHALLPGWGPRRLPEPGEFIVIDVRNEDAKPMPVESICHIQAYPQGMRDAEVGVFHEVELIAQTCSYREANMAHHALLAAFWQQRYRSTRSVQRAQVRRPFETDSVRKSCLVSPRNLFP